MVPESGDMSQEAEKISGPQNMTKRGIFGRKDDLRNTYRFLIMPWQYGLFSRAATTGTLVFEDSGIGMTTSISFD